MSRELRFRVWHPKTGLHEGIELGYGDDGRFSWGYIDDSGVRVDQWTGLTDRHGRDIYEADVIGHERLSCVVRFGPFEDSDGYEVIGWYLDVLGAIPARFALESRPPMEVLGNVHQNPELLGQPPASS